MTTKRIKAVERLKSNQKTYKNGCERIKLCKLGNCTPDLMDKHKIVFYQHETDQN